MAIFVSYSRLDEDAVKALAQGFEAARRDVWFDHDLGGGEVWWVKILENIRKADVVVFALSDNALRSTPCRSELNYALALDRNIVPIKVGPVANFRANPLSTLQTIEFRENDAHAAFEIIAAVDEAARSTRPLPQDLPPEPPIPFLYLVSLGKQIDAGEPLSQHAQLDAVDELRKAFREETDESVHDDIVAMLRNLKAKRWATVQTVGEVDVMLDWIESRRRVASSSRAAPSNNTAGSAAGPEASKQSERERREAFAQSMADAVQRQQGVGRASTAPDPAPKADPPRVTGSPQEPWRAGASTTREPSATTPNPRSAASRFPGVQAGPVPAPQGTEPAPVTQPPAWRGVVAQPDSPQPPPPHRTGDIASPPLHTLTPATSLPSKPLPARSPPGAAAPRPYWGLTVPSLLVLPIGLVALYFSVQVGQRLQRGELPGARSASGYAFGWGLAGVIILAFLVIISLL